MAQFLSKTNIVNGNTIQAADVSQSIDAFTGAQAYDITLSGSLILTGSQYVTGSISSSYGPNTVGFFGTASWAVNAVNGAGVTINNNTNNNLLTATGIANTINGEATLTYDGNLLQIQSTNAAAYVYSTTYDSSVYLRPFSNASVIASFFNSTDGKGIRISATPTRSVILFDSSSNFQLLTAPLDTINSISAAGNAFNGSQVVFTAFSQSRNILIGTGSEDTGFRLTVTSSISGSLKTIGPTPKLVSAGVYAPLSASLMVTGSIYISGSGIPTGGTYPATSGYVIPGAVYGPNGSKILGEPDSWLQIVVDGGTYYLPLYA
jgi:hypothetical protein